MGDVSKHFSRKEFECSDGCGFKAVDNELLEILEKVREYFKKPVIIHCACRCLEKNRSVGSEDTSQHVKGMAVDFHIDKIENMVIRDYIENVIGKKHGLGIYDWGIHVDVRGTMARWDHRTK